MEFVSYLSNVSPRYDNYLFALLNGYNSKAEKAIKENYEKIAEEIGKNNVIVRPMNRAISEAKKLFEIKDDEDSPILLLSHFHPEIILSFKEEGKKPEKTFNIIKISLGRIHDEDKIKQILSKLMSYIKSNEYEKVTWMNRIIKINNFIDKIPIIASLKTILV